MTIRKHVPALGVQTKVDKHGRILFGTEQIRVPKLRIESHIGSGANGFVFRARNTYLDREEALKIWTTLRRKDRRDKFKQGIAEARKAVAAAGSDVVAIYDAGELRSLRIDDGTECRSYFYASMEYFPSVTLSDWLDKQLPTLALRCRVARRLLEVLERSSDVGIYHGDFHSGNILIGDVPVRDMGIPAREPSIRVIDFGTSLFVPRKRSIARHWRVVNETFRRLLHPMNINRLAAAPDLSECEDPSPVLIRWYWSFLAMIPILLIGAGAEHLRPPQDRISDDDDPGTMTATVKTELDRLVRSGALKLTQESIGPVSDYEEVFASLATGREEHRRMMLFNPRRP